MRHIFPDAVLGFLVGLIMAASFLFTVVAVDHTQTQICVRQKHASVAVPYLISAMDEIHGLLTLPPDKSTAQRTKALPPKIRAAEQKLVSDLDKNLAMFVSIERGQPKIHC